MAIFHTLHVPKDTKVLYDEAPVWKEFGAIVEYDVTPGTNPDFEVVNSVLVKYHGTASDVVIPDNLGITTIGSVAFLSNQTLTSVVIPSGVTAIANGNFLSGEGAFRDCINLLSVKIPNAITDIGEFSFYGCEKLKTISLPDNLSILKTSVFSHCYDLETVTIPNSVTVINPSAFFNCSRLSSVTLPNTLAYINGFAFNECTALASITIPASVTRLYNEALSGCTGLEEVTVEWTTPLAMQSYTGNPPDGTGGLYVFSGIDLSKCTLKVPAGTKELYEAATVWEDFCTIVESGTANTLSVSPSLLAFTATGGAQTFDISSNVSWTVSSTESWATVSAASGSDNSTITVTTTANSGSASRTARITVSGGGINRTVDVTQDAAQQIIAEPTMPVDGQGSIEVAFEVPVSEQFRISFTVTLPAGFILDEQATSLVSELQSSYRLSITPDGRGGWLFEVMHGTFLRSGNETAYRKIVNIVYTVSGTVQDGKYEVKIRDVNLILNSGETVHQDEISVPVTIDGASGNSGVEAVKILYYKGVLSVGTPAVERITVYAISGVPVYQAQKEAGVAVFNLTHLPRGIYIINGNSGWVKKVVIN